MAEANSPATSPASSTETFSKSPQSSPNELIVRVTDEDEEEEIIDDEDTPRPFPFRLFGVGFLLIAIATAVILASVPKAVEENKLLDNEHNGYVADSNIFIFCLFSSVPQS